MLKGVRCSNVYRKKRFSRVGSATKTVVLGHVCCTLDMNSPILINVYNNRTLLLLQMAIWQRVQSAARGHFGATTAADNSVVGGSLLQ